MERSSQRAFAVRRVRPAALWLWLPLAAVLVLTLGACASSPSADAPPRTVHSPADTAPANSATPEVSDATDEPASPEPLAPEPAELARLYEELETSLEDIYLGLEGLAAGDSPTDPAFEDVARDRLRSATAECASIAGCDISRFLAAYDQLLREQGAALETQQGRIETMEEDLVEEPVREPGTAPFSGVMPEQNGAASLLRGTDLRDLIELNGPVSAALDDWLTWMRPDLMEAWHNYQFLRPEIAPIYEDAGLPEALLFAMIATESKGKVHAYSHAGAAGPLQFMRYTGRIYGLNEVDGFDTRLDPAAATRANVAYLNANFKLLNNSLEKVLAAYNGGENRMKSIQRRYDGASLWDRRVYYSLPRETREYVPRVLAAAWLFLHPEDFNLEFPPVDNLTAGLSVRQETSLSELTVCLGQEGNREGWFRTLRNLNPRLDPGEKIPVGEEIRAPKGTVSVYEASCLGQSDLLARARTLHEANYPEKPEMIPYTVRSGDTLNRIAGRFRCAGMREIAAINNIRGPRYVIRIGQRLNVPACE